MDKENKCEKVTIGIKVTNMEEIKDYLDSLSEQERKQLTQQDVFKITKIETYQE